MKTTIEIEHPYTGAVFGEMLKDIADAIDSDPEIGVYTHPAWTATIRRVEATGSREAEGAGHRCPSRTPLTGGGYVQCELAPGHECDHRAIYPAGESIVDAQWKNAATGAASGEATEPDLRELMETCMATRRDLREGMYADGLDGHTLECWDAADAAFIDLLTALVERAGGSG